MGTLRCPGFVPGVRIASSPARWRSRSSPRVTRTGSGVARRTIDFDRATSVRMSEKLDASTPTVSRDDGSSVGPGWSKAFEKVGVVVEPVERVVQLGDDPRGDDRPDRVIEPVRGVGNPERGADLVPGDLGRRPEPALPPGPLDQGIDHLGPEGRAGGVARRRPGRVSEDGVAEVGAVAPDVGDPVPALDELAVDLVAGRGDLPEVVEDLRDQAGVEHAAIVGHLPARVDARPLEGLADLAECLPTRGGVARPEVLRQDDRPDRRADLGAGVEELRGGSRASRGVFPLRFSQVIARISRARSALIGSSGRCRKIPRRRAPPRR